MKEELVVARKKLVTAIKAKPVERSNNNTISKTTVKNEKSSQEATSK